MFRLRGQNCDIFGVIVSLVTVDVVCDLTLAERAPQLLLGNLPMFMPADQLGVGLAFVCTPAFQR